MSREIRIRIHDQRIGGDWTVKIQTAPGIVGGELWLIPGDEEQRLLELLLLRKVQRTPKDKLLQEGKEVTLASVAQELRRVSRLADELAATKERPLQDPFMFCECNHARIAHVKGPGHGCSATTECACRAFKERAGDSFSGVIFSDLPKTS